MTIEIEPVDLATADVAATYFDCWRSSDVEMLCTVLAD